MLVVPLYRRFEDEIQTNASEDPLEPWLRYVQWARQAFTSITAANPLIRILERATHAFVSTERYRNDARYVKLWIAYVRFKFPALSCLLLPVWEFFFFCRVETTYYFGSFWQ